MLLRILKTNRKIGLERNHNDEDYPTEFIGSLTVSEKSINRIIVQNNPINFVDPWGLSRAVFDRVTNSIYIYPGDSAGVQGPPQRFPASNRAQNLTANPYEPGGFGPAPSGTFPTDAFREKNGAPNSSYGSGFIPIILPQQTPYSSPRTGVGIHAGRANTFRGYGFGTQGCIRTTEDALDAFRNDSLTQITIK